ncbi:MAG: TetR/AcrR family transcriptional regulator [Leptospiraceae bacterium]
MADSAQKPDSYHHGALKNALLESGVQIIQLEGIHGLTLSKVARKQGVSAAAVYRHYESKEALLAAIAAQGFDALREALDQNLSKPIADTRVFFRRCVEAYVDLALSRPRHYDLMFGGIIPDQSRYPELYRAGQSAFQRLIESIRICQRRGLFRKRKPIIMAFHVWSTMHGFAMLHNSGQNPLQPRETADLRSQIGLMVQLLRRGLDVDAGRGPIA